jgi:hypothetical protein
MRLVPFQIPLLPAWAIMIHKSQIIALEDGLEVVSSIDFEALQERGLLDGGGLAVRTFMERTFGR